MIKEKINILRKVVAIFITILLVFPINIYAIENEQNLKDTTDINNREEEQVTAVDENGKVLPLNQVEENMPEEDDDSDNRSVQTFSMARTTINNSSVAVVNFNTKGNAVTNYTEDGTNRAGYTNGAFGADGAFLGYDNESSPKKVKFMQSGVIGWVSVSDVQVVDYNSVQTLTKYYVSGGRLYHGLSTKISNTTYASRIDCGPKPSYLKEGTNYYSYDGHYFYEGSTRASYSNMLTDYRNNVRTHSVNNSSPFYNYYQYLSHRSITKYSASQLNNAINYFLQSYSNNSKSKMRNMGSDFISNQNKYGINALMMIGVAANESQWGLSNIAQTKNNLFGHKAYDSDPSGSSNGYSSPSFSIYYHASQFLSLGYLDPITDSRYYGAILGDKAGGVGVKYASDPYWGEKNAGMCWRIDSYLGGTDSYRYTIGIKDTLSNKHTVANIKSSSNDSSTTLYSSYPISSKSTYKTYAPSHYAFIVINNEQVNGFYKIQSDGSINNARNGIVVQSEYNFDKAYGYVSTKNIYIASKGTNSKSSINTSNVEGQPTGKESSEPTLYYSSNCQDTGWLETVNEPNTTGTTGRSLNLYQLKLDLRNGNPSAYLSGKVYNGVWKNYDNISNSTVIGDNNKAIQIINFTANNLTGYRLQYRVHSADIGWQSWVNEGTNAGSSGHNIQAIDFRIVKDSSVKRDAGLYYSEHLSNIGWTSNYVNGSSNGNTTERLEAFKVGIDNLSNYQLTVKVLDDKNKETTYAHVTKDTIIGTTGQYLGLKLVNLTLSNCPNYELSYRVYVDGKWTNWASQGQDCGTRGSDTIKDIQIKINYVSHITSITLNKNDTTLQQTNSETLKATINPSDATDDKTITWEVENENIAKVDEKGNVTGEKLGSTTITATTVNGKKATCKVTVVKQVPNVTYRTHVQDIRWQEWKSNGEMSGTSGKAKRLEGIEIKLNNNSSYKGSVQYQTHVQDIGWQEWKSDGKMSGTSGQSKRLEAIRIRLTDELKENYDIYYRVHAQDYGWLDWAKNGEESGTSGLSKRLEGIEIKIVEKGGQAPGETGEAYVQQNIGYQTHVQDIGWQEKKYNGEMSGTSGKSKRLEGIKISLSNQKKTGSIEYQTHVQNIGWQSWKSNGEMSGTSGKSLRLEAIRIKLTGEMENSYDVYYRVHAQGFGWLDWAKNGEMSGTSGYSYRLEGIEIKLVKKGKGAPGSTSHPFYKK